MKNFLKAVFLVIVAIGLVLACVYGVWCLVAAILAWVMAQPSQIAAAIIAFAGTIIAGIGAVVISQQHAKTRDIAQSHRPKKIDLYSEFITQVVGIMRDHKGKKELDGNAAKNLEDFFFHFTTRVMLWGSPAVLRHYGAFRRVGQQSDPNVLLLLDDILQAMRRDIGLSNWGLARGDLIKMLLTDPESLDAVSKNTQSK